MTVSLVVLKLSSTYGPDPADVEFRYSSAVSAVSAPGWSVPPFAITTLLLTMPSVGRRQDARKRRVGLLRREHHGGVVLRLGGDARPSGTKRLPFSSRTRLSEKATSVAVSGVPSEKTASSRSVNVYWVASSLTSQLVARLGLGSVTSLFSNVSSVS